MLYKPRRRKAKGAGTTENPAEYDRTGLPTYGYARGSTNEQVDTLDAQGVKIREYCLRNNLNLVQVLQESTSGGTHFESRPQGLHIINALAESGGHIVVIKVDRIVRSIYDFVLLREWALKRNITIHVMDWQLKAGVGETALDRLICSILVAVAEMERTTIQERTRSVNDYKRKVGKPTTGNPPLGFTNEAGEVVIQWEEFRLLLWVLQARLNGGNLWPCARVANTLNKAGYTTRSGRAWTAASIATLVQRNPVHRKEKQAQRQGVDIRQLLQQLEDNYPETIEEVQGYITYARMPT